METISIKWVDGSGCKCDFYTNDDATVKKYLFVYKQSYDIITKLQDFF